MKISLATFILLCFILPAHGQLVNGGFETWNEVDAISHPETAPYTFISSNFETLYNGGGLSVTEVAGVMGSGMRVESTMTDFGPVPGFAIWGVPPEGEELVFSEGFSLTDGEMTGLAMDIRHNVTADSPGILIVQFKYEGALAGPGNLAPGTYFFPISGEEESWTSTEFNFMPALDEPVDECIIAFASNNAIDEDAPVFPGDFIEVANLSFIGSDVTIPGGDFETWVDLTSPLFPESWTVQGESIDPDFFQQSTDAAEGQYAVQLNTVESNGMPGVSYMFQGTATDEGILPSVVLEPNFYGFSFEYKYEVMQDDTALVVFALSESLNPNPEDIFYYGVDLPPADTYTLIEEDLSFIVEANDVNYFSIAFVSSMANDDDPEGNVPQIGSSLLIDAVSLLTNENPCDYEVAITQGDQLLLCPDEVSELTLDGTFDSYQWYKQGMFGGDIELLEGETNSTLEINTFDFAVFNVWCEVSLEGCSETTDPIGIDGYVFVPTVIASNETEICEGESTVLEAIGAQGTVAWYQNGLLMEGENDNFLTVTETGNYVASIFPDVCPETELSSGLGVGVTVYPLPEPTIVFDGEDLGTEDDYETYSWFYEGEPVENGTGNSIPFQGAGLYTVEVTTVFGCVGEASTVISSIHDDSNAEASLFPNPTGQVAFISGLRGAYTLCDLKGRTVQSGILNRDRQVIDVQNLASGMYILQTSTHTLKLIKQ